MFRRTGALSAAAALLLGSAASAAVVAESVPAAAVRSAAVPAVAVVPGGVPALAPSALSLSALPAASASAPASAPAPAAAAPVPAASPREAARAALDRRYFGGGPSRSPGADPEKRAGSRYAQRAQEALGLLDDPRAALAGRTFSLDQWRFVSFLSAADLGEPTIDGKPAAESKLEFKEAVAEDGSLRRYSWLALGATPAGTYRVEFPGLSFTVVVAPTDTSTPEERAESARAAIKKVFSSGFDGRGEDGGLPFGPAVPENTRAFLGSHLSLMGRHMSELGGYIEDDPFISERERARRRRTLEDLKDFYAGAVSGERAYGGVSPLIAQLLSREPEALALLRGYLRADPGMGRAAGEIFERQIDDHRGTLRGAYDVYAQAEALPPPGPVVRFLARLTEYWMRWRLRRGMSAAVRVAGRPAAPEAPGLRVSPEVAPEARAFISGASARLSALAPGLSRYIVADASLDEAARTEALKRLGGFQDFLADRAAGEGFRWTVPAMATRLRAEGVVKAAESYAAYVRADASLPRGERRKRLKDAEALARFVSAAVPR